MGVHISRPIRASAPDFTNKVGTKFVSWWKQCGSPNVIEIYHFPFSWICGCDGTVSDPFDH